MTTQLQLDSLTYSLARTAAWRRSLVLKYEDPRNERAATQLEELAKANVHGVDPEVWERISPHLNTRAMRDALNEASRDVGFRRRPDTFNDFLEIVIEKLPPATTRH